MGGGIEASRRAVKSDMLLGRDMVASVLRRMLN